MSGLYTSIPVQYLIETKSDWTHFSIIGVGFWWSDIEVECLKGEKKLTQDVTFCHKIIKISKKAYDKSLVKLRVTCKMNINEKYLGYNVPHLIEKGDIEYTIVRIFLKGKEINYLEHKENVKGNPSNPKKFSVLYRRPLKLGIVSKIRSWTYAFVKGILLFVLSYGITFFLTLVYCYPLSLDFLEVARTNPHMLILGSVALFASLITIALKRNWI